MKRFPAILLGLLVLPFCASAQLLRTSPAFPKEDQPLTITMDAGKGNRGLFNYSGDVFLHVGLITSKSADGNDWKYVPFTWGTSPANGQATAGANNTWTFTINDIRAFFNITDPAETIRSIALLYRDAQGNSVQRNADGSNMYIPVYHSELAAKFLRPLFQPTLVPSAEPLTIDLNASLPVEVASSKLSNLRVFLNGTQVQAISNATTLTFSQPVTQAGNNTLLLESTSGAETAKDSVQFFVNGAVNVAPLPAGTTQGINYLSGNTSVVLVLYAPNKQRISVIGEFPGSNWTEQTSYQMNRTPDGNTWWLRIDGLTAGTEYAYQYLVNGNLKIADPYTEKILDPYNNNDGFINSNTYPNLRAYPAGQSGIVSLLQTNAAAYNWTSGNFVRPDKRNLFIYELLLRDFVAGHDWKTLSDTISYLKQLGVNAIELLPFNEFEGNESWGYNPDFYFAPDKYYGPKNTLKAFIDIAHQNGIAVIMDIALNHSFGLSPMVQLYWDAATNRPSGENPWFNPTPRHSFNVGYDMNHESAATNYFFSRVTAHWLKEYRIDGFRFDLSKGFTQKQSCDIDGGNCNFDNWNGYDASRIAIWKKYYDSTQLHSPGSYAILEHLGVNEEEKELSNYGMMLWGNINHQFSEASMGYMTESNFDWSLHTKREWANPAVVAYMESHDEERMAFRNINYGATNGSYNVKDTNTSLKRLELAATFLMAMPGPKMIWQFGEVGYEYSINSCPDGSISNDCRLSNKPVRWDYMNQPRRRALYEHYSKMAQLRYAGSYRDIYTANNISVEQDFTGNIKWLRLRSAGDTAMICVIGNFNTAAQAAGFRFPKAGIWTEYLTGESFTATGNAQVIPMQAGGYKVFVWHKADESDPTTPVTPPARTVALVPNPVSASSVLYFNPTVAGRLQASLFTLDGKQLASVYDATVTPGTQQVQAGTKFRQLPSGIYLLRVQGAGINETLRFIKQ
ncbi:MAG: T9SS type A sorting domain-containing protein [Chitinophagaceae bacterium]|nr:MAG: T9SS type A sorting domain-containing protein [Chitinophagaceae bacterium]